MYFIVIWENLDKILEIDFNNSSNCLAIHQEHDDTKRLPKSNILKRFRRGANIF